MAAPVLRLPVAIAELGEEMGVDVQDVAVTAMALQVRIDDELTWVLELAW